MRVFTGFRHSGHELRRLGEEENKKKLDNTLSFLFFLHPFAVGQENDEQNPAGTGFYLVLPSFVGHEWVSLGFPG